MEAVGWLALVATELHKVFSPWLWHKETAASTREDCKASLALRFAELDAHLARRAQYLMGDTFTVADAYCFTVVNWANMLGLPLGAYPSLQAYLQRAWRPAQGTRRWWPRAWPRTEAERVPAPALASVGAGHARHPVVLLGQQVQPAGQRAHPVDEARHHRLARSGGPCCGTIHSMSGSRAIPAHSRQARLPLM